ncbi:hypothetical protein N8A98_05410 [Devosia neptuniae]|jgi:hypothetical protein|uniref:Uncharacterized protein n=1 Tax=Devosia neptuniae TaxID=191302 RepID=A0ABY6CFP0_9HYPH|nr:hypothetical protein [Devosia neptuniae]UXN70628.1 hypothetical protein N8A98_05410 [Devosia neptuniae]
MGKTLVLALAILLGAVVVAGAVVLRPTGFGQCVGVVSAEIERDNPTATLDPRDVEVQAAKVCSGYEGN